jgi:hypothetical protein
MAVNPDAGWDLSIKDRNGQLVLVVQVKRKTNASPDWAAAFRVEPAFEARTRGTNAQGRKMTPMANGDCHPTRERMTGEIA